jgi:hypothetical protein
VTQKDGVLELVAHRMRFAAILIQNASGHGRT